jgi:hypothetical protein
MGRLDARPTEFEFSTRERFYSVEFELSFGIESIEKVGREEAVSTHRAPREAIDDHQMVAGEIVFIEIDPKKFPLPLELLDKDPVPKFKKLVDLLGTFGRFDDVGVGLEVNSDFRRITPE